MGAVLSDEGCFGRTERPWDDRWEALQIVLKEELEAREAREGAEAKRLKKAKESVLLGRVRSSSVASEDKASTSEDKAKLLDKDVALNPPEVTN